MLFQIITITLRYHTRLIGLLWLTTVIYTMFIMLSCLKKIVFYLFRNTRTYTLGSRPYITHFSALVAMKWKDFEQNFLIQGSAACRQQIRTTKLEQNRIFLFPTICTNCWRKKPGQPRLAKNKLYCYINITLQMHCNINAVLSS